MKTKIVIYVEGGVVQEVRTNSKTPIVVELFDVDNLKDEMPAKAIDMSWDKIMLQCPQELPM